MYLAGAADKEPGAQGRATCSRSSSAIIVSTSSCAPRVFRRASQGPRRPVVPSGGCKARPDRRLRTAVSSAGRAESLGLQGRIIIASTPHLCVWV
eukprot:scaffold19853_cov56-Phaeocystis_antarctica.AAC.5